MNVNTQLVVTTASTWQLDPESTPSDVDSSNATFLATSISAVLAEGHPICRGPTIVTIQGLTYRSMPMLPLLGQFIIVQPPSPTEILVRIDGMVPLIASSEGTGNLIFVESPSTPPVPVSVELTIQVNTTGTTHVRVS